MSRCTGRIRPLQPANLLSGHLRHHLRSVSGRCISSAAQTADQTDHYFMGLALQQAAKAFEAGEVPIGAVLVSGTDIISTAYNQTEQRHNPLCHAELLCIMSAADQLKAWRLQDATLYSTLEPCPMCAGAILQARIKRLVYGAKQPRIGADGSWVAMFPQQVQQQKQKQKPQQHQQQQLEDGANTQTFIGANHDADAAIPQQLQPAAAAMTAATGPDPEMAPDQQEQWHQQDCDCILPNGNHPFHTKITVTSGVREEECRNLMQLFFRKRRSSRKSRKPIGQYKL